MADETRKLLEDSNSLPRKAKNAHRLLVLFIKAYTGKSTFDVSAITHWIDKTDTNGST